MRGIPPFVEDESYVSNFGFEWTKHAQTQLDRESNGCPETKFCDSLEISPEKIYEKLVLDAGCGMGRFAEVASRYGARVVGVDLSRAVESAHKNLGDRPNVQILQADLLQLPLRNGIFDFIHSIGVLHHTPNCEATFRKLVPLLKPGGRIVVWLYSGYNPLTYKMSDFTVKLQGAYRVASSIP
jgi:2-polyprenyl-3-methyl-5-hydroxy-6-metoxy-1,4-benzoquinol methylase